MKREAISKKLRFEVFKRDNFTCQYCGRMAPEVILEIDHINPISNNGDNNILNLITSCRDCNRGKGKRKLTDKQELEKQQEQLKELNEKQEQLKELLKWKKELEKFSDKQVNEIEKLMSPDTFTEHGKNNIKKQIEKYGFEEVYESFKIAIDKYELEEATKKLGGILYNRRMQNTNPDLYLINKICYYARQKYSYFDEARIKIFIKTQELNTEQIEDIFYLVKTCRNWSQFLSALEEMYEVEL